MLYRLFIWERSAGGGDIWEFPSRRERDRVCGQVLEYYGRRIVECYPITLKDAWKKWNHRGEVGTGDPEQFYDCYPKTVEPAIGCKPSHMMDWE